MKLLKTASLLAVMMACGLAFAAAALAGREIGSAPGCWLPEQGVLRDGLSYRGLLSGGRMRCYLAYIPPGLDRSRPAALVLSLHGFAANPDGQRANARWDELAADEGFVVAYPQGSSFPLRWNIGPGTQLEGIDDVQFLRDVVDDLAGRVAIDDRRVYLSGFSNGGDMVHAAACQLADRVAAAGIVSGFAADPAGGCHPSQPMPVIAFLTGPDLGGELLPIPDWLLDRLMNVRLERAAPPPSSPRAWAEAWAQRNGCDSTAVSETLARAATQARFTGCAQEAEVVLVSVPAMGHAWPGGPALPGLGENTDAVDATKLMWEFFGRHLRK